MKVTFDDSGFKPVTIRLETPEELKMLTDMIVLYPNPFSHEMDEDGCVRVQPGYAPFNGLDPVFTYTEWMDKVYKFSELLFRQIYS